MLKKKKEVQNLSNVCRSADNQKHTAKITPDPRSEMNTQDASAKNNIVILRSIGGTHTRKENSTAINNMELDRVWLEHFARAIYKNGVIDDRQYRKLLSMIDRELKRMYRKAA